MEIQCELDKELFTCCKCKCRFKHTEGTWLPTGRIVAPKPKVKVTGAPITVLNLWATYPPEIETSDKFTCYNCL